MQKELATWNISGNKEKGVRACVIVAHPDDETIFMGGTILRHKNWEWEIISLTFRASDKPRGIQFTRAIDAYRAYGVCNIKGRCLGMRDEKGLLRDRNSDPDFDKNFTIWSECLRRQGLDADIYFTHNCAGEYGHSRHKAVHAIVTRMFDNVWEFVYPAVKTESKINRIRLTNEELAMKNNIFRTCYVSERYLWQNLPDLMSYQFKSKRVEKSLF